jgi:hypothetical protein
MHVPWADIGVDPGPGFFPVVSREYGWIRCRQQFKWLRWLKWTKAGVHSLFVFLGLLVPVVLTVSSFHSKDVTPFRQHPFLGVFSIFSTWSSWNVASWFIYHGLSMRVLGLFDCCTGTYPGVSYHGAPDYRCQFCGVVFWAVQARELCEATPCPIHLVLQLWEVLGPTVRCQC